MLSQGLVRVTPLVSMAQGVVMEGRVGLRAPPSSPLQRMGHSASPRTLAVEEGQEMDTKVLYSVHMSKFKVRDIYLMKKKGHK